MSATVRRALREDSEAVLGLITELAHYERLDPPNESARARLLEDGWGDSPRFEAWLAEIDGIAVGYAIVFETYSTFLARPTLYLEDIFVLPEHRGKGAGYALFHRIAQESVARGCGRTEWACLDWNTPSIDFYERMGARQLSEWRYFRMFPEDVERLPARESNP